MNRKYCPYCNSNKVIKFGQNSAGRQRYRCQNPDCMRTWVNKQTLPEDEVWHRFIHDGLPARSLAELYHCHPSTIHRLIKHHLIKLQMDTSIESQINLQSLTTKEKANIKVIIMDATYFGRNRCAIVAIDASTSRVLYLQEKIGAETTWAYQQAIEAILAAQIHPQACVIDGRMGVRQMLEKYGIIVQYCLFHVLLLANQCLTRHPQLLPNQELRYIVEGLCAGEHYLNEGQFVSVFFNWRARHLAWLNEQTRGETGKLEYSHPKTRKLANSLARNYPYYFAFERYPDLHIPRTSSKIEGLFGFAKTRLHSHRGYTNRLRSRIFEQILSGGSGVKNNRNGY